MRENDRGKLKFIWNWKRVLPFILTGMKILFMKKNRNSGLTSKVKNGVIPLPKGAKLPEGCEVSIVPLSPLPDDPPFLKAVLKLAKPRNWPVQGPKKRRLAFLRLNG
jgi:hypothetical protein